MGWWRGFTLRLQIDPCPPPPSPPPARPRREDVHPHRQERGRGAARGTGGTGGGVGRAAGRDRPACGWLALPRIKQVKHPVLTQRWGLRLPAPRCNPVPRSGCSGGGMGGQAGRIGSGSACTVAQAALPVPDLTADGACGVGDGGVDQAREMVVVRGGDEGRADMEARAKARDANGQLMFDSNGDGKLTAADAAWNEFRVWQDADQDGVTDAGELKTLDPMGFTEIGLTYDDGSSYAETDDDVIIQSVALQGVASYLRDYWRTESASMQLDGKRQIDPTVQRVITFSYVGIAEICRASASVVRTQQASAYGEWNA
jgi:hypothetical protein